MGSSRICFICRYQPLQEWSYVITDSIQIGETELVFGKLDNKIPIYVTWACKGGDNYYWGTLLLQPAGNESLGRAGEELEYQKMRQGRSDKGPKETDEERDR